MPSRLAARVDMERARTQGLARVGSNLNQLAHWANIHKSALEAVAAVTRVAAGSGRLSIPLLLAGIFGAAGALGSSPPLPLLQPAQTVLRAGPAWHGARKRDGLRCPRPQGTGADDHYHAEQQRSG